MSAERAPRSAPRLTLTGGEWKLLLTAVLGVSYSAVWLAIAGSESAPATSGASTVRRPEKVQRVMARASKTSGAGRLRTRSS